MGIYAERMRARLQAALAPDFLEIEDLSARHVGHAGAHPEGETHFRVTIVSKSFLGLARPARHRLVYAALERETAERVHALEIKALLPEEIPS